MITKRQQEVLCLMAVGSTASDAGGILGISELTVKQHLLMARRKLKVKNTTAAVYKAVCLGIIPKLGEEP